MRIFTRILGSHDFSALIHVQSGEREGIKARALCRAALKARAGRTLKTSLCEASTTVGIRSAFLKSRQERICRLNFTKEFCSPPRPSYLKIFYAVVRGADYRYPRLLGRFFIPKICVKFYTRVCVFKTINL